MQELSKSQVITVLSLASFCLGAALIACATERSGATPSIRAVEPSNVVTAREEALVTILGQGFVAAVEGGLTDSPEVVMPAVSLLPPTGEAIALPASQVSLPPGDLAGGTLLAVIPAGRFPPREAGEPDVAYGVQVINPDGQAATLANAITISAPAVFEVSAIDPPFACTCARTTVTIVVAGGELVSTPSAELGGSGATSATPTALEWVAFVDDQTMTAVVPAGVAQGSYDVVIVNPPSDGRIGVLEAGFKVVALPVPTVLAVMPSRGDTQTETSVSIYGSDFRDPVKIELIDATETVVHTIASETPVSATRIDTTLPTQSLPTGAYLVRVTNGDEGTFYTFAGFLVTNPSANLQVFAQDSPLTTGRRLLAGAVTSDDLGNRFIYAIGGDAGQAGAVLDTLELSQLSRFGVLGQWRVQRNRLQTPRVGASAVAFSIFDLAAPFVPKKTYVYVTGGLDDHGNVLGTVERAVTLASSQAPRITAIEGQTGAGSLALGTWYYKVAAVLDASNTDNPGGETLASDAAVVTLPAGAGAVTLRWDAVTADGKAAVGYRIYRTDEVDGRSQQEHRIAEVTEPPYTDGGEPPGMVEPLLPGDTGMFVTLSEEMLTPRWGHQAVVVRDETRRRSVLILGGSSTKSLTGASLLASLEAAAVDEADGSIEAFGNAGMTAMGTARAFFAAAVETSDNVSTFAPSSSRLWVAGGLDGSGTPLDDLEDAGFDSSGTGAWNSQSNRKTGQAAAGMMILIANDKLFTLGGANSGTAAPVFGDVRVGGRDIDFQADGSITTSLNATGNKPLSPRALGVAVVGSGFFYMIGGTSDGVDALATTERTY